MSVGSVVDLAGKNWATRKRQTRCNLSCASPAGFLELQFLIDAGRVRLRAAHLDPSESVAL
jgi:hypothetical protein